MNYMHLSVILILEAVVCNDADFTVDYIQKVCHEVKVKDDMLVKDFQSLSLDDRDAVFPHMKNYAEAVEELIECMQKNETMTMEICKDVIAEDAPKFLNLPYDLEEIKSKFNWTKADAEELYSMRRRVLDVWWDLDNILPHRQIVVDTPGRTTWF